MKITKNTVLITGGSSGIGFQIAKLLSGKENTVIITGRDAKRLAHIADSFPNIIGIPGDLTNQADMAGLIKTMYDRFPELNILINNAGFATSYRLGSDAGAYKNASAEMALNFLAPVQLTESLLPLLQQQQAAAIVNMSSIAAYSPNIGLPTYSATKAALHSWSQILRLTLSLNTDIKLFEVFPPWVEGQLTANVPPGGMSAERVAQDFIAGFEKDDYEIRVGYTREFYKLFMESPEKALLIRNGFSI